MATTHDVKLGAGNATGMFYHAPSGTELPDYPDATLGSGWTEVGYISEDGITWATGINRETLKDWSKTVRRTLPSEDDLTVQAPIISTTEESLGTLFGENAVETTAATTAHGNLTTVTVKSDTISEEQAFLFIGKDGDDMFLLGTTAGYVKTIDDITFAPGDPVTWNATIAAASEWVYMIDDGQST